MSTKKDKFSKKDKTFMELALNLAKARHGLTGVNPSVGCVIVKNNEMCGVVILENAKNPYIIQAKSYLMAAGGAGSLFMKTTNPPLSLIHI